MFDPMQQPYAGQQQFQAPQLQGMPGMPQAGQFGAPGALDPNMATPMAGTAAPGQLDPAMVQAMLKLQQQGPAMQAQQRQMKLAQQLRGDAAGQLEGKTAGRTYRAPGLLNLAANIMGNLDAGKKESAAEGELAKLGQQRTDAMQQYYDALQSQLRG